MAIQAKSSIHKFEGLEDTPAIKGIEKIYEANEEARQKRVAEALEKQQNGQGVAENDQQTLAEAPSDTSVAPAPSVAPAVITAPASEPTSRKAGKKAQNGNTR